MKLVWVVIPLVLIGVVGVQEGFSSCVQGQTPCLDEIVVYQYEDIPQASFEIQITKEVFFESENIHVRLLDIEDSRCPFDVQCVWEGQVTVDVKVSSGNRAFEPQKDLGNYTISLNEPLDGSTIQLDQYSLQLLKVKPHPTSTEPTPVWDYVAIMKFTVNEILPPLNQIATGKIPENVLCKEGLELIFKSSDNSPACVKPQTAEKLIERGWLVKSFFWVERSMTQCGDVGYEKMHQWVNDNPDDKYTPEIRKQLVKEDYAEKGINVLDVEFAPDHSVLDGPICEACYCPSGQKLVLKIDDPNSSLLNHISWKNSTQ